MRKLYKKPNSIPCLWTAVTLFVHFSHWEYGGPVEELLMMWSDLNLHMIERKKKYNFLSEHLVEI